MPSNAQTLSSTERTGKWVEAYQPEKGFFDEWQCSNNATRKHWDNFMGALNSIPQEDFAQREEMLRRTIIEHGITYNVYSAENEDGRIWKMDAIPMLIDQQEHQQLERALGQRMHLLNLILQDIYGQQHLIQSGQYPAGLVLANPSFLRNAHNLLLRKGRFLHMHTSDVARSPDGSWWVLSDRLDAASGLGYSIENRMLSTRVMPDLLRKQNVMRLLPYIELFSNALKRLSPREIENPLIVLLTPGPFNETYFEQSYLARALGFPLVEGDDLTVRDNKVFLKTTEGAKRVDVILRRLDSDWCDPLELRDDSLLGVPGLINAIRKQGVAVVNTPGVGVLETPALPAFLPTLCRSILGEDLLMPSVATWWCGQPLEMSYVLNNLEYLVIKPTFRRPGHRRSIFGAKLSKKEREELTARIKANPEAYTAQEMVSQATTPIFHDNRLEPRHFLLRLFMVRPGTSGHKLMPGGLCRVAKTELSADVSMQTGGESKDVWVIDSDNAKVRGGRLSQYLKRKPSSHQSVETLPSRAADNLFWLGRYIERAEGIIRSLITIVRAVQESRDEADLEELMPFVEGVSPMGAVEASRHKLGEGCTTMSLIQDILSLMLSRPENPGSLLSTLMQVTRTAHTVKERIPANLSRILRDMPISQIPEVGDDIIELDENFYHLLNDLLNSMAAYSGTISENTTRGQGWYFQDIGRRIERSIMLIDCIYDCLTTAHPQEEFLLIRLLEYVDSTVTYRRRYLTSIWPDAVCNLLISDATNPRSLAFQVQKISDDIKHLPHYNEGANHQIDRMALRVFSTIWLAEIEKLLELDEDNKREAMKNFLHNTLSDLRKFSNVVSSYYFSNTSI